MMPRAYRYLTIFNTFAIAIVLVLLPIFISKEAGVEQRLGPESKVQVVGPCRTFGPDHPECIRQANLITVACVKHPETKPCRALRRRLRELTGGGDSGSPGNQSQGGLGGPPLGGSPNGSGDTPRPPDTPEASELEDTYESLCDALTPLEVRCPDLPVRPMHGAN